MKWRELAKNGLILIKISFFGGPWIRPCKKCRKVQVLNVTYKSETVQKIVHNEIKKRAVNVKKQQILCWGKRTLLISVEVFAEGEHNRIRNFLVIDQLRIDPYIWSG